MLATLIGLDRLFQADEEDGSLDLMTASPVPLEGVVLAKVVAHWLTTGLPLTLASPLFGLLVALDGTRHGLHRRDAGRGHARAELHRRRGCRAHRLDPPGGLILARAGAAADDPDADLRRLRRRPPPAERCRSSCRWRYWVGWTLIAAVVGTVAAAAARYAGRNRLESFRSPIPMETGRCPVSFKLRSTTSRCSHSCRSFARVAAISIHEWHLRSGTIH